MIFLMSKYLGQTLKFFDIKLKVTENGDTISLFDETNTLFGKRYEIQDTHDRGVK